MPSAPCFVNPKLYGKQKYFSEFSGERKHAETLFFQPVPSGGASSSGQCRFLFSGSPGIIREEKRSRFLFTVDRKRKTDAYQP
ncbi:MAG: hypothetical protein EGQ21_22705, partial [Akkermansia sp.]|nr:hypothetical protein [Akkermansia sp.]